MYTNTIRASIIRTVPERKSLSAISRIAFVNAIPGIKGMIAPMIIPSKRNKTEGKICLVTIAHSVIKIPPTILIIIFERIKPSEIKNEFINVNKKSILITALYWGTMIVVQLRAYQLGNVTVIAPLCALTVILNVIVGYLFLNEKDNLLRKLISAILIIISVILIKV